MVVTSSAFVIFTTSLYVVHSCYHDCVGCRIKRFQRDAAQHKCCRVHQTMKQFLTWALVVIHHAEVGLNGDEICMSSFIQRLTDVNSAAGAWQPFVTQPQTCVHFIELTWHRESANVVTALLLQIQTSGFRSVFITRIPVLKLWILNRSQRNPSSRHLLNMLMKVLINQKILSTLKVHLSLAPVNPVWFDPSRFYLSGTCSEEQ